MIRKIRIEDLKPGMFVEKVDNPWLNSPLVMSNFSISSEKDIKRLQDYDIRNVFIDTSKGSPILENISRRPSVSGIRASDTFAASLDDFWVDRQMPVDIYNVTDYGLEIIMRSGLTFGSETYELLRDSGVKEVHIPNSQKLKYDQYQRTISHVREKQKETGFDGQFLDPVKVNEYHRLRDSYQPINPWLFVEGTSPGFDIFAMLAGVVTIVFKKGEKLGGEALEKWRNMNLNVVIRKEDSAAYQAYIQRGAESKKKDDTYQAAFVRENAIMIVEDLASNPRSEKLMKETKGTVADLTSIVMNHPTTFYSLMKINNYDYYTYTHSVNVSTLSLALALEAGITDRKDLAELGVGCVLHDLGKSKISRAIINKPGKLTDDEFLSMKRHVLLGFDMLDGNPMLSDRALIPVLQHHEKLTGAGYPSGLSNSQIDVFGRISGIIDIYDALTTERPYKKALKPFDALVIISKALRDYDSTLFRLFVRIMERQEG